MSTSDQSYLRALLPFVTSPEAAEALLPSLTLQEPIAVHAPLTTTLIGLSDKRGWQYLASVLSSPSDPAVLHKLLLRKSTSLKARRLAASNPVLTEATVRHLVDFAHSGNDEKGDSEVLDSLAVWADPDILTDQLLANWEIYRPLVASNDAFITEPSAWYNLIPLRLGQTGSAQMSRRLWAKLSFHPLGEVMRANLLAGADRGNRVLADEFLTGLDDTLRNAGSTATIQAVASLYGGAMSASGRDQVAPSLPLTVHACAVLGQHPNALAKRYNFYAGAVSVFWGTSPDVVRAGLESDTGSLALNEQAARSVDNPMATWMLSQANLPDRLFGLAVTFGSMDDPALIAACAKRSDTGTHSGLGMGTRLALGQLPAETVLALLQNGRTSVTEEWITGHYTNGYDPATLLALVRDPQNCMAYLQKHGTTIPAAPMEAAWLSEKLYDWTDHPQVLELVDALGASVLRDVPRHTRTAQFVAQYLAARLGNQGNLLVLAFALMPSWPGTLDQLALAAFRGAGETPTPAPTSWPLPAAGTNDDPVVEAVPVLEAAPAVEPSIEDVAAVAVTSAVEASPSAPPATRAARTARCDLAAHGQLLLAM